MCAAKKMMQNLRVLVENVDLQTFLGKGSGTFRESAAPPQRLPPILLFINIALGVSNYHKDV